MLYKAEPLAVAIFLFFVLLVLSISFYFARKTKSSKGYYAAGGQINWGVNGIAFAGDYLSAASFLGICGLIAFYGYDGFLYSIGYLAGWIVALFVVAEPMKRLGKFTFTDALDSKFNSKGIQLMAGISTLVVSMFYLIPQMVGAGSLVVPLLGLPHAAGVIIVGVTVVVIVATAGMASTTYVQFLKGGLLILLSIILVVLVFSRGISTAPDQGGKTPFKELKVLELKAMQNDKLELKDSAYEFKELYDTSKIKLAKLEKDSIISWWEVRDDGLYETQYVTSKDGEETLYNGFPKSEGKFFQVGHMSKVYDIDGKQVIQTGKADLFSFIRTIKTGIVITWKHIDIDDGDSHITVYYQKLEKGSELLKPGMKFAIDSAKGATTNDKLSFISLMIALFFGTAALPHILIRYYTVPSPAAARKSTIVAIAAIGFFYALTIFMGLGAMVNGTINLESSNMSAPLLARSFGTPIFASISALAFATVLGTVSGLIVATSGAIARDLLNKFMGIKMSEQKLVTAGKLAAIGVGAVAIILGIIFKGVNVSFLVGWAFSVAASANLPSIVMLLFWKKTTSQGIIASISVGLVAAVGLILLSQPAYNDVYHLINVKAPIQLTNPAIISIPLSFIALVIVSLKTQHKIKSAEQVEEERRKFEE
jgi:cation/acetate symporter